MRTRDLWVYFRRIQSRIVTAIECWLWEVGLNQQRVTLLPGYTATSIRNIRFGSDVLLSHQAFLQGVGGLNFGSRIMVGPGVSFITASHELSTREPTSAPISIKDGVWVGANATILPGVTVGEGSIVAAGAVVTQDVPPNVVVGGVPARLISELPSSLEEITYFANPVWRRQF